ncbi:MAG: ABC transporter substrate-binding protein [Hyphomicrobiales bacterium]|nr:ABC transporter substrate-binding protein [Hyphomicrobiales bacterium]
MKTLLYRIAVSVFVLVLGSASASAQQTSNVTLRVASFAGPFGEALQRYAFDLYTRRTGVKIEVQFANPADFLAKMIASRGREAPFDIVCLDDDVTAAAIDAGVLQKIDPAIVTNLKHLYPEAVGPNGYGATLFYFSFGIAYHKDQFRKAKIPAPASWNDLWDPRLAGRVSVPDIINIQGRDFIVQMARMNGGSEATPEIGINKIAQIKAHSYYTASNTLQAQLESGDVWAAPWNNMRAAAMADRGLPIGFVTPKEGSIGNTDTVNLVAGARNVKQAQELINYMLDPFAQLGMAKLLPTGPSTKLLAAIIESDADWRSKAPVTPEAHRALYLPNWSVFNKNLRKATDHWNRVIHK